MNTENKSNTPTEIRDLWQTPSYIFDHYDRRYWFTVDLAASRSNALCDLFVTEEMDALQTSAANEWIDVSRIENNRAALWCNPPYSNIMPWVKRCIELSELYNIAVVMLIPSDTSVKWFKMAYDNCTECHFISGRLSFVNAETQEPVSGNNKGSVVFIFDPRSPVKQSVHLIDRESMK